MSRSVAIPVGSFRRSRRAFVALGVVVALVAVAVSQSLGISLWHCPIREFFGIDCPGCGMTRSLAAALAGRWHESLHHHALGPAVLVLLGVLILWGILPQAVVDRLARRES